MLLVFGTKCGFQAKHQMLHMLDVCCNASNMSPFDSMCSTLFRHCMMMCNIHCTVIIGGLLQDKASKYPEI